MGAATDFENAPFRRLLVGASYWTLGLEEAIPADSNVDLVGTFTAPPFGNDRFVTGVKPADHAMVKP